MALKGVGMLCTRMDADAGDVAEFNRWYDKEHMEERVSIPGFRDARRYTAVRGKPKYLNLYETESLNVFNSPAYRERLAHQTEWSRKMMSRFKNFYRSVGRITVSRGIGHGAFIGFLWLKPVSGREESLRKWLEAQEFPALIQTDDILSAHLLESDPVLSGPPPGVEVPGGEEQKADDWFAIIEGSDSKVVAEVCRKRFPSSLFTKEGTAKLVSSGLFALRSSFGLRNGIG